MGAFQLSLKLALTSYFKFPVSLERVIKMCFVDHSSVNVCIIYRPPNLKLNVFFPKLFEDLLLEMKALNGEIFLMGDLNVDIIGSQRNFIDYKILLRLI